MIQFNPLYDSPDTIKQIRATALANLVAGVIVTEFISEGSQFQGVVAAKTDELLLATEIFLDEWNGNLVTETQPNFAPNPLMIYGS